jgi:hypothetical protein
MTMRSAARKMVRSLAPGQDELSAKLGEVTHQLAGLNRELASQLVLLASQTGDTAPLMGAVRALRKVQAYYAQGEAPRENAEVHEALADTLFKLGRARGDIEALQHAVISYRSAITLASLLGEDKWRRRLRRNYNAVLAEIGDRGDISNKRVA